MTGTLFEQDNQDDNQDYLNKLVGEGLPYATVEDIPEPIKQLAKGKHEADNFIRSVTTENRGLREELTGAKRLEDLLKKLEEAPQRTESNQHSNQNNGEQPVDIEGLLDRKLSEMTQRQAQSQNLSLVKQSLQAQFGNNYVAQIKQKALQLGLSEGDLDDLSRTKPQLVLELMGATQRKTDSSNPPQSSINTLSSPQVRTDLRNKSYYDKLRKTDSSTYWSPKVQVQMHKDAIAMGDKFDE